MVPARNLLRRHYDTYGGGFEDFLQEEKIYSSHNPSSSSSSSSSLMIPSPYPMAGEEEQETSISSSSKNSKGAAADYDCAWLQLGVGSSSTTTTTTSANTLSQVNLDLDLFSNKPPQLPATSLQQPPVQAFPPQQYGFGSYRGPWGSYWWSSSSTPSSTLPLPPPQQQPFQYCTNYFPPPPPPPPPMRSELTVISPPTTRRQAGVWFLLQAAENQGREPLLPQISKSYLRIKDGRMTVRLLMKYLVKKLRLHDESEVEISCRGQVLHPYLTLQHVRDNIWCLREAAAFLSDSPTDHVMTLQYGRSSSC